MISSCDINPSLLFDNLIWRIGDVVEYTGLSKGHIYNLTSRDEIPHTKKGKILFFVPEEIRNWILEGNL